MTSCVSAGVQAVTFHRQTAATSHISPLYNTAVKVQQIILGTAGPHDCSQMITTFNPAAIQTTFPTMPVSVVI